MKGYTLHGIGKKIHKNEISVISLINLFKKHIDLFIQIHMIKISFREVVLNHGRDDGSSIHKDQL